MSSIDEFLARLKAARALDEERHRSPSRESGPQGGTDLHLTNTYAKLLEQANRSASVARAEADACRRELAAIKATRWFRLREKAVGEGSLLRRLVRSRAVAQIAPIDDPADSPVRDIEAWFRKYQDPSEERQRILEASLSVASNVPRFAVQILDGGDAGAVSFSVAAFRAQAFHRGKITVIGHPASPEHGDRTGEELEHIEAASPFDKASACLKAAQQSSADFAILVEAGFVPSRLFILEIAAAISRHKNCELVFADHEILDPSGKRVGHRFKPDWNPLLLLNHNYIGPAVAVRTDLLSKIVEKPLPEGEAFLWTVLGHAAEYVSAETVLHIPRSLGGTRNDPSLAEGPSVGFAKMLGDNLGYSIHEVVAESGKSSFKFANATTPRVSVIIPTRDRGNLLRKCIESFCEVTDYPNYQIIVLDNDSTDPETIAYFAELSQRENFKVEKVSGPFNFPRLNNVGAAVADGEIFCLLNNDMEIVESGWLRHLVAYASRPEVGSVGCRLLFPDRTVQHAGVIVGYPPADAEIQRYSTHPFKHSRGDDAGYMNRAIADQWITAVTGACLLVKRSVYEDLGGLDEENFAVAYNDIDFCLRCSRKGLTNIYAGSVTLLHHESVSRGPDDAPGRFEAFMLETEKVATRFGTDFLDPHYNVNLSLEDACYELSRPPRGE